MTECATFGGELRRLRGVARVSLSVLAQRIHYSKSYLSKVENGVAQPNGSLASLCDEALDTGGVLTALLVDVGARKRTRRVDGEVAPFGLPPVTSHFTGRAAETSAVLAALRDDGGVCVLSGMAGVGKTALAVRCGHRVASRFPDGVLFMDLRGHTPGVGEVSAAEALDRFLRLLGVPGDAVPVDVDDRAALYRDRLRGRRMLVVLDNARSARQVTPLLPAEPRCRVLITSRHRLSALDDASHVAVGGLPVADGVELFRTLLGALADNDATLGRLAGRCGELPLAIRIAAARLQANPSWRLADLDRRLGADGGRLDELDDGERSVTTVFRVSLDALTGEQRAVFGLLALHPGADVDLHAAAALTGLAEAAAERQLGVLRDGHLVIQEPTGRFRFHDLVRSFAVTEVVPTLSSEEQDVALTRVLEVELHAAEVADRLLAPTRYRRDALFTPASSRPRSLADVDTALSWVRDEWPNLIALCRLALAREQHTYCWRLAFSLRSYFFLAKLWDAWIESQQVALAAAAASADRWAQAISLNNLGMAMVDRANLDEAADYYEQALALFRELDDHHGISTTLANHAWVDHYRGNHRTALRNLRTALEFYEKTGATRNVAITLRGMALVETASDAYEAAVTHAEQALTMFAALGLDLDITMTHNCLGWAHFRSGRWEQSESAYRAALASCDRSQSAYEAARAETGLGNVMAAGGHTEAARKHWTAADARQVRLIPMVVGERRARDTLTTAHVPLSSDSAPALWRRTDP